MRKTNIPNKLNHKPQAHARVCDENEEEDEKKTTAGYNILRLKDRLWKPVEGQRLNGLR